MKTQIELLRASLEEQKQLLQTLDGLGKQEAELKTAKEKNSQELASLPAAAVALPDKGDKRFDSKTSQLLSYRRDIETRLDLIPGIKVRYGATADGLKLRIRDQVRALIARCLELANARVEKEQSEIAALLLPYYGGQAARANAAAAVVMRGEGSHNSLSHATPPCDAWNWRQLWRHHANSSDAWQDPAALISLAESFELGEPRR
jgi:hypothetical protein